MPNRIAFRRLTKAITLLSVIIVLTSANLPSIQSVAAAPTSAQSWSGWSSLGKPYGGTIQWPVVGQNQDGRLEVFAQIDGLDSTLYVYHLAQSAPGSWNWSYWDMLGYSYAHAAPAVGRNQDGRLDVFAQNLWIGFGGSCPGPHYDVEHIYQTAVNNGWSTWVSLDHPVTSTCVDLADPYVNWNQDGRLEVWAKGADGNVWEKPQIAVNGGWGSWSDVSKPTGVTVSPRLVMSREQDGRDGFCLCNNGRYLFHVSDGDQQWLEWLGRHGTTTGWRVR